MTERSGEADTRQRTSTAAYFELEVLAEQAVRLRAIAFAGLWPHSPRRWFFAAADHPYAWLRTRDSSVRRRLLDEPALHTSSTLRDIIGAEYPAEAFAGYAIGTLKLDRYNPEGLKEICDRRAEWLGAMRKWVTPGGQVGLFAGAVALVVDRLPKEVIEGLGWDYVTFQMLVFVVLLSSTLGVAVGWLLRRSSFGAMSRANALARLTIMYLSDQDAGWPHPNAHQDPPDPKTHQTGGSE